MRFRPGGAFPFPGRFRASDAVERATDDILGGYELGLLPPDDKEPVTRASSGAWKSAGCMLAGQMQLLAISGSLRAGSSNTELLRAAARLAIPPMHVTFYEGLADLPAFNPDLMEHAPVAVLALRGQIRAAAGLLISSPEYGHGVPGTLKNALDWLFSGEEMVGKPVALLNASPLSVHADASLRETITVMSARLVEAASVTMPVAVRNLDAEAMIARLEVASTLRVALTAFARAIDSTTSELET